MTGLECLREEMEKRGCTKSQIESKTAAVVLDILANMGHINTDIVEAEMQLAETKRKCEQSIRLLEINEQRLLQMDKAISDSFKAAQKYIDEFYRVLSDCETPEGKDAMKRAQMFVNSVSINTKYDNTAFIAGLAAILSDGQIGALDELQKINPKVYTQNGNRL